MLRTTREAANEHQPATLQGRLWIIADVRLDCRADLIDELKQADSKCNPEASDPELILAAYDIWGEESVLHLRGDFGFAVWDAPRKKLFCARDHFGVKPFFYAVKEDFFLFSNTLNCLRLHPEISNELNEGAIGDFLLFGLNCDIARTTFRDIQRLPPAHFLSVSADNLRIERYWSPPIDGRIRYRRDEDYVEHFRELLKAAVADRLRADRVGILLSGGLDSGSAAATAREISPSDAGATQLRAFTKVFESLFPDDEGFYARKTAEFLKIPIEFINLDALQPFERWEVNAPEPLDAPFFAGLLDDYQKIAAHCRVVLSGEGADNLLYFQMWPYARDLLRRREWRLFLSETARFLWVRPFPWRGIRYQLRRLARSNGTTGRVPDFIAPDFVKRLDLEERYKQDHRLGTHTHPLLPKAYASITSPYWAQLHELDDPGATRCNLEFRFPFCDLRIVNYLLAIPPFPWHFQKTIIRELLKDRVPEVVRLRRKAPFAGSSFLKILQRPDSAWADNVRAADHIERFINRSSLTRWREERDSDSARVMIRPFCLNFWLQSYGLQYNLAVRGPDEDGKNGAEEALRAPRIDSLW